MRTRDEKLTRVFYLGFLRSQTLLELWSSGSDGTRIACFLAIRKLVSAGDEGVKDMVLKVRSIRLPFALRILLVAPPSLTSLFLFFPFSSRSHSRSSSVL